MKSASSSTASSTSTASPRSSRAAAASRFSALVVVGDQNGSRRRRPRQGERGARGDPQGHRAGAEEPVQDPARQGRRFRTRCSATSAPARCCSSRPRKVRASSPAARSAPCVEVAGIARHPDEVHRHLEPAQRHPRDGAGAAAAALAPKRRCARAARPLEDAAGVSRQETNDGAQAQSHADPLGHQPPRATRS